MKNLRIYSLNKSCIYCRAVLVIFITLYIIAPQFSSVQFSSVAQSCPSLCNLKDCSTPGLPVHHQLQELAQTHVHGAGDAIQPSHPLSAPSPPAFTLSQHQGLSQRLSSSHQVAKGLEYPLTFITGRLHLWTTILQWPLPLHPLPLYPPIWSFLCFFSLSYCLLLKYNWLTTLWILVVQCSDLIILCTGPLSFFKIYLLGSHQILTGAYGIFSCGWELLAAVCGISLPQQGSNPGPLRWECSVLATGPLG